MTSFFSALKGKFSAKFDGRYLALILQEIGNRHPKPLISFICDVLELQITNFRKPRFETEYCFKGKSGNRLADLAIFRDADEDPSVLIEVKYFDKPLVGDDVKPAQLEDYIAWKKSGKHDTRHIVVLSREMIRELEIANRSWSQVARHLKRFHQKSDLTDMLVDYLKEEGVVMRDISSKCLLGFLKRLLCGPKSAGVLANNLKGPAEFSNLLTNMRLLSVPFDSHFKYAWRTAGEKIHDDYSKSSRIATIDYAIENRCKTEDTKKLFDKSNPNHILGSAKDGGIVWVFARYSLGHGKGDWLRVEYGFCFDIDSKSSQDNPPVTDMYARAYGDPIKLGKKPVEFWKKINFNLITTNAEGSTEKVERSVNDLLQKVLGTLLDTKSRLNPQQQSAVRLLLKSLRS